MYCPWMTTPPLTSHWLGCLTLSWEVMHVSILPESILEPERLPVHSGHVPTTRVHSRLALDEVVIIRILCTHFTISNQYFEVPIQRLISCELLHVQWIRVLEERVNEGNKDWGDISGSPYFSLILTTAVVMVVWIQVQRCCVGKGKGKGNMMLYI